MPANHDDHRLTFFEAPGPGFSFLRASNEKLAALGLPLRPDKETAPLRYAFWHRTFAEGITILSPPEEVDRIDNFAVSYRDAGAALPLKQQGSTNWSGGYITPRDGTVFTEIHATWQVPSITVGRPTGEPFGMSTWIGLDGQRGYHQASLPQAGTGHYIPLVNRVAQAPAYVAWVQWWHKGPILQQPYILPVPVAPGEVVRCSLVVQPPRADRVRVFFANETRQLGIAVEIAPPIHLMPLHVSGATAEWISERPSIFPTERQHAFPRYTSVLFSECLAISKGQGLRDQERALGGGRRINMYERLSPPPMTPRISVARLPGGVPARQVLTNYQ